VEIARFELREGVALEALLQASGALEEGFLAKQRGYLGRELLRQGERSFVDLVRWADRSSADAAMAGAMASPACTGYFGLMVPPASPEAGMPELLTRVARYG